MFKRVVVPIGRDKEGERAIPIAAALADRAQVPVELVTVVEPIEKARADATLRELVDGRRGFAGQVIETGGPHRSRVSGRASWRGAVTLVRRLARPHGPGRDHLRQPERRVRSAGALADHARRSSRGYGSQG